MWLVWLHGPRATNSPELVPGLALFRGSDSSSSVLRGCPVPELFVLTGVGEGVGGGRDTIALRSLIAAPAAGGPVLLLPPARCAA